MDGNRAPASGTWIAVILVAVGLTLALLALKYRHFEPPPVPETNPTTTPAAQPLP